jgi:putative DNA primase/helicase
MKRAHRIEAAEIEWVIDGIIPARMMTLIAGRAGEGKSTLAAALAAIASQTAPVIFSNQEDPHAEVVRPRLEAAGAKLSNVFIPEMPFMLPTDLVELERRIVRLGARIVFADSANQHLAPNATSGQGVRKALTPLKAMLERTGCAFVFIDHLLKKPGTGHPLQALSGAGSGLPAACRFVYAFGRNPNDPNERVLAPVKVNAIRADCSFAYEMQDGGVFTAEGKPVEVGNLELVNDECEVDASEVIAYRGGGKAQDAAVGVKGTIAAEWLIGTLMFGVRDAADVKDEGAESNFSWRTLQRAAEKIPVDRVRVGFGKGSKVTWALPDKHPALKVAKAMGKAGKLPKAGAK